VLSIQCCRTVRVGYFEQTVGEVAAAIGYSCSQLKMDQEDGQRTTDYLTVCLVQTDILSFEKVGLMVIFHCCCAWDRGNRATVVIYRLFGGEMNHES